MPTKPADGRYQRAVRVLHCGKANIYAVKAFRMHAISVPTLSKVQLSGVFVHLLCEHRKQTHNALAASVRYSTYVRFPIDMFVCLCTGLVHLAHLYMQICGVRIFRCHRGSLCAGAVSPGMSLSVLVSV